MDVLPEDNTGYGRRDYWDERYAKEDASSSFDWFRSFADIADEIHAHIPEKSARILMLGCGNSTLSQDMYDDGYHTIINVDYSRICIEKMQALHSQARPSMTWQEEDVRDLPFPNDSFDVALDKGTMDAMMTSKGDVWNPPQEDIDNCNTEVDEALRVLRPGGIFFYVTFGRAQPSPGIPLYRLVTTKSSPAEPHFRRRYLTRPSTTLDVKELKTQGFSYFLYILKKHKQA